MEIIVIGKCDRCKKAALYESKESDLGSYLSSIAHDYFKFTKDQMTGKYLCANCWQELCDFRRTQSAAETQFLTSLEKEDTDEAY